MSILTDAGRQAVTHRGLRAPAALLLLGGFAVFLFDLVTPRGVADGQLYVAVIAMAFLLRQERELVLLAAVCSAFALLGAWLSPPGADLSLTGVNRAIAIGVVWVIAALYLGRLRAERIGASAEHGFRDFVENAPVAIHWAASDGRILWANAAELALLGYPEKDYVGRRISEFHVDPAEAERILSLLRSSIPLQDYEARLRCRDGSVREVLISSNALMRDGRFVHTRRFTRDVTAQRMAERARSESEARFRELADVAPVMIWMSNADRQCVYLNRRWLEFSGRSLEAGLGMGWYDSVHPEDRDRLFEAFGTALARREPCSIEYRLRNAYGEYRWVRDHGLPRFSDSGELQGYVGSAYDVTDLMKAAALLRRSNALLEERVAQRTEELAAAAAQYRELVESLDAIVWRCDPATMRFTFVTPQAGRILGFPPAQWTAEADFFARHLHPQDRQRVLSLCAERASALQHHQTEYRMIAADGREVWLRDIVHVVARDGKAVELIGVMVDITDRVRTEEALMESEGRLWAFMEHSPALMFIKDRNGRYLQVNKEFEAKFGLRRKKVIGRTDEEIFEPGQAASYRANDKAVLAAGIGIEFEEEAMYRGGRHVNIVSKFPLRDARGQVAGTCGIAFDITERKAADKALRDSEQRFRLLVENVKEYAIFMLDPDGRVASWNSGAERINGYRASEIIGQDLSRFYPPGDAAQGAPKQLLVTAAEAGHAEVNGWRVRKSGSCYFANVSVTALRDEAGTLRGFAKIIHDITERRRIEEEMRGYSQQLQALSRQLVEAQERERKNLARELHDRVGQSMTALKINLEIFKSRIGGAMAMDAARLDDSLHLVEQTMDTVSNLTSELRPPMLDDCGLLAALRWYASLFERRTGIEVSVGPDAETAPRLPTEAEAALFRIAQEALTNVARHARARRARVTLRRGVGAVTLRIADDGCGFDLGEARRQRSRASWGMITMRERAQAVGARFDIESMPGHGTTITIAIPGSQGRAPDGEQPAATLR
jgi:PAS domain S-box-containing protein